MRQRDDPPHLHGELRWRRLRQHADRHHVPVRLQRWGLQRRPLRHRELLDGARGRLRQQHDEAYLQRAWQLFGRHLQLHLADLRLHRARCHLHRLHATHLQLAGLLRWQLLLDADRLRVPVRVQRRRLQPRPLRQRQLQFTAGSRLCRFEHPSHVQLAWHLLGRQLQLFVAELPLHSAFTHLSQRHHRPQLFWRLLCRRPVQLHLD